MKIPFIPEIEGVSDLLDLLGKSRLYKERLEKLHELQSLINEQLRAYEGYHAVDEAMSKAHEATAKARLDRDAAAKELKDARVEAQTLLAEAGAEKQRVASEAGTIMGEAAYAQSEAAAKKAEVEALFVELERREKVASEMARNAQEKMSEAGAIRQEYEQKLAGLRNLVR